MGGAERCGEGRCEGGEGGVRERGGCEGGVCGGGGRPKKREGGRCLGIGAKTMGEG